MVVERQLVPVGWGMMSRTPASQAPARASTPTVGIAAVPGLGCTWFWWLRDTDKCLPEPDLRPADLQLPSGVERGPRCRGDPACIRHDHAAWFPWEGWGRWGMPRLCPATWLGWARGFPCLLSPPAYSEQPGWFRDWGAGVSRRCGAGKRRMVLAAPLLAWPGCGLPWLQAMEKP